MKIFKFRSEIKSRSTTSVVEIVSRKEKLDQAQLDEQTNGEHRHYFSKREVASPGIDPKCKVCGITLSELTFQRRSKASVERFRAASDRAGKRQTKD